MLFAQPRAFLTYFPLFHWISGLSFGTPASPWTLLWSTEQAVLVGKMRHLFCPDRLLPFLLDLEEVVEGLVLLQHLFIVVLVSCEVKNRSVDAMNIINVVYLWLVHESRLDHVNVQTDT